MEPKDIFGLVVRTAAFLFSLYGLYDVLYGVLDALSLVSAARPASHHLVGGILIGGTGACIIRLANRIAAFAYPPDGRF